MNRPLLFGVIAGTAAWLLARNTVNASRKIISVKEAAAKLKQAWPDHHTTA